MTSRERVEAVLNHQIPDSLPNCWGGCETAGLHILAYNELVRLLGLKPRLPRVDTFMFNAVMDEDVLLAMDGDMLLIDSPLMCAKPLRAKEGWAAHDLFGIRVELTDNYDFEQTPGMTYLLDRGRRVMRCPAGGTYFDNMPGGDMFGDAEVPNPSHYHPSHEIREEKLRQLEAVAKEAYETTDFALCLGETVADLQLSPGGMIAWYDALLNEPEITDEYLGKNTEAALDQIVQLEQAVGKYCSIMSIAHDLGDSRGVTIGPRLFRERYKPFYKKLFEGWHARTKMKVNLHSCGAVSEIIPDLIECGVDVLNPVQISANGMNPERVRDLAGDKLVLYGGALDCIMMKPGENAETVYQEVKRNISILGRNGNYLFAGVHNTAANTPAAHIGAALRAYRDMRNMYAKA